MEKADEVKFSSNAHGIPEPVYYWTKGGEKLTDENVRISFSRDKKELKITDVQRTDSGDYHCVASNKVNTTVTSNPAKLTVKCKNTFAYLILEPSRLVHVCFKRALLLGCPCHGTFSYNFGFRSSVQKNGHPGEGRHEGLVPRNDVLISGFIRFSLAQTLTRIFFVPHLRRPQKPRRRCESRRLFALFEAIRSKQS